MQGRLAYALTILDDKGVLRASPTRCARTHSPTYLLSQTGTLALHIAAQSSATPNVIKKIINAYPDALFRANIVRPSRPPCFHDYMPLTPLALVHSI